MRKVLLCNLDLLRKRFDEYGEDENEVVENFRNDFLRFLDAFLQNQKDEVLFYSLDLRLLNSAKDFFNERGKIYKFVTREQVNQLLQNGMNADYGNSFNAVRNMLNHLGANKIVFVSLGTFGKPFEKWDYEIHGNIFDIGYGFKLIGKEQIRQEFNYKAKDEVAALYSIFNDE